MFDLSIFIKELKGRFAQWYNRRHGRYGVLWADRFKSILLEDGQALAAVAAYIELNPVRAGVCADPKAHRYSGYQSFPEHRTDCRLQLSRCLQCSIQTRGLRQHPSSSLQTAVPKRNLQQGCAVDRRWNSPVQKDRDEESGTDSRHHSWFALRHRLNASRCMPQ